MTRTKKMSTKRDANWKKHHSSSVFSHHRRFSSSSDGTRKPKAKGCFKCGQQGHMKKECPQMGRGQGQPQSQEGSRALESNTPFQFHKGYGQQQQGTRRAKQQASQGTKAQGNSYTQDPKVMEGTVRKSYSTQFSSTQKKDFGEVNESKVVLSKHQEEKENEEPTVEFVHQSSPKSSDSEEPEEDSEEQLEEDSEEGTEEQLEEDSELEPEEDPEEGAQEQLEDDSELEPEEDPEEILEEGSGEEPEEESAVDCGTQSLSHHNNDETQQLIEDPDEDEDPSEEEYVSEPSSEDDTNEPDHNSSNEKKRSVEVMVFGSTPLQVYQSQKKCKYEEAFNPDLDVGSVATDPHFESVVSGGAGSSGKRRRSRWDSQPEKDGKTGEGDGNSKKRKTRWSSDDSQLKMFGPLQLPNYTKDFVGSELDPEILGLRATLFEINSKLRRSELHDDRPEGERSPSPPPVYNNLGIRINTREVRLREKLIRERGSIISTLIKKNPTFKTTHTPQPLKLSKKLYIPVKEYPTYNFVGLILGPMGNTQKRMEKETGAKILLRGKGSMKMQQKADPSDNEDLHVFIEAGNKNSLDAAVAMVEELLIPRAEGMNDHKRAQLEELAKLKGNFRGENVCSVCKEEGHKSYACPQRQSTFKSISCDRCGSISHNTSSCPLNKLSKETSDANLYVGYIPQAVDDNRLRELFSPFGKITEAKVIKDRTTGTSKGYGFVKFENPIEADLAVTHMNGYQMDGNMLAVKVAGRPPSSAPAPSSSSSNLPIYPGPPAVPPGVLYPAAWVGVPQAQVSFPNFGATTATNTFPVVSSLGGPKSSSSSPGLLAHFPGDPDYPGSEFNQYFTPATLGPSTPFYFGQMP